MSYATPQQPPAKKTPWVLIIGGVLGLIAIVLCSVGGYLTFSPVQELAEQPQQTGSHSVELEEGESIGVWSENEFASCTAQGPGGPVSDAASSSQSVTWGDTDLERVMLIEADESGSHTISCSAPFVVGDGLPTGGVVTAALGGALCCIAVIVMVIGLVVWLMRRKG